MLTYVDDRMLDYLPYECGLLVRVVDDLNMGEIKFEQRQYPIWVATMKVSNGKRLWKGTSLFHDRIGWLCTCMYKVRDWVLDMQKQGHSFTIVTSRFDIGIDDCWGVIETAMGVCWDGLDVVVCDG